MYGAGGIELFFAEFGESDEDRFAVNTAAVDERSFLHTRQLMGEATFVPGQHAGEDLLADLAFHGEAGQDPEFRACEAGSLGDVASDAGEHVFVHEPEGMPDAKFLRG